jgi:MFS family permease
VPAAPLRRNRDFVLLEVGRALSTAGSAATTIAYPLLVLAITHSPAKAGLVSFARMIPYALFALAAGVAADRWNRKWLMLAADGVRALAIGGLAAAVSLDGHAFWPIPLAAFVEGAGSVFFVTAATGALKAVVPTAQLPLAVGAQRARGSAVQLAGPAIGGALFALGRAVPFVVDSVSYLASIVSVAAMRTPFQERREPERTPLRAQLAEAFHFLWDERFIRATTFVYALANFAVPGLLLVVVVVGKRQGLTSTAIGGLMAAFGAALLAGSLLSPLVRRRLSLRTIILVELWASLGVVAFLIRPSVWVLAAGLLPQALAMPVTDSVVVGYRVAVTPDRLLGRAESIRSTIARLLDPLGPLAAGLLLTSLSERETVAAFLAWNAALLVWGHSSPAIRHAPSLDELDRLVPAPR